MENKKLLSICIPTYNRADCVKDALDSIISQNNEEIEIIISDNASTDNTRNIVNEYKQKFSNIKYFCHPENIGPDRNFYEVVRMASGRFCWLLSSDDILEKGAVSYILKEIRNNPSIDIYIVKANPYSKDFTKIIPAPDPFKIAANGKYHGDTVFVDAEECVSTMATMMGFISTMIVNREEWSMITGVENYFNSVFVHMYILSKMLQNGSRLKYIDTPLVGWRSDNDSFLESGLYKRLEYDVKAYYHIYSDVFGERSKAVNKITTDVIRTFVFWRIRSAKIQGVSLNTLLDCLKLCFSYYKNNIYFWCKVFPVFITPSLFWKTIRWLYRKTLREYLSKSVSN